MRVWLASVMALRLLPQGDDGFEARSLPKPLIQDNIQHRKGF
jgi:hypothetical protein